MVATAYAGYLNSYGNYIGGGATSNVNSQLSSYGGGGGYGGYDGGDKGDSYVSWPKSYTT